MISARATRQLRHGASTSQSDAGCMTWSRPCTAQSDCPAGWALCVAVIGQHITDRHEKTRVVLYTRTPGDLDFDPFGYLRADEGLRARVGPPAAGISHRSPFTICACGQGSDRLGTERSPTAPSSRLGRFGRRACRWSRPRWSGARAPHNLAFTPSAALERMAKTGDSFRPVLDLVQTLPGG